MPILLLPVTKNSFYINRLEQKTANSMGTQYIVVFDLRVEFEQMGGALASFFSRFTEIIFIYPDHSLH